MPEPAGSSSLLGRRISKLRALADSSDWERREAAGFALRDLIEQHFGEAMSLSEDWVRSRSARVRRAACLACMQRKRVTTPSRVRSVLGRLAVLMKDDDLYVRKCCGPFVVGYLGYTYPSVTLPWLRRQARRADLNVRANVAKAFSQALGGKHAEEGLAILSALANDARPRVRQAVLAALRNIGKRSVAARRAARELAVRVAAEGGVKR